MIDYSVFMMGNPLKPNEAPKAYAKNQVKESWTMDRFVQHIASHNGVFSRGTVKGVIADMCDCLVEQLLNGNKVQLGELGTFGISISSVGAVDMNAFTVRNIKKVNILFEPGPDFENLLARSEFNQVASRMAQSATLKAEQAGQKTVDLTNPKKENLPGKQPVDPTPVQPSQPVDPGKGESGNPGEVGGNPGEQGGGTGEVGGNPGEQGGGTGGQGGDPTTGGGGLAG